MKHGASPPRGPGRPPSATLPVFPHGTSLLTIGRQRPDSHQRGGAREHVARVQPTALRTTLLKHGPGRYRVSCLDQRGRFLKGGAFVMEVSAGSPDPMVATARKPNDYARRPSPTSALRRGERRVERRVQLLQDELRATRTDNARLRREAAVQREQHAREFLYIHETMEALKQRMGRLTDRLKELDARENERSRRVRGGLTAVRKELTRESRRREEAVAELAARAEASTPAASEREERAAAVATNEPAPLGRDEPQPASMPPAPPTTRSPATLPVFDARTDLPHVERRGVESGMSPPRPRPPTFLESVDRFFQDKPPRPK